MLGSRNNYFIKDGYLSRAEFKHFDDTPLRDEFQDNVYAYARRVAGKFNFHSVVDIGCGSGFKLLKHFTGLKTVGLDVPETVAWLKANRPEGAWCSMPFSGKIEGYDFAICSDVIEHLLDPDALINFIIASNFKRFVISTPARENCREQDGPPQNVHHVREWTSQEFKAYLKSFDLAVANHVVEGNCQYVEVIP